ncbi:MAG: hypothetical protein AB7Q81_02470 [Gammaproteobacteria bacterium]
METTAAGIACWRCGARIDDALFPLRREEVCAACNADLHVCKQCRFFNARVSDGCDEPLAGGVSNKERANFCDYFTAVSPAADTASDMEARARADLDALFGGGSGGTSSTDADANRSELERLFGLRKDPD